MKQWMFAGMLVCAVWGSNQAGAQPIANAQWNADLAAGRFAQVERATTAKINAKGVVKAAMSMSKIREALQTSLELDNSMFAARSALAQFYLLAPGLAGGRVSKARELAQNTELNHPDHAKVLMAMYFLHEGKLDDAEQQLNTLNRVPMWK